jgi:hypothetical protein
MTAFEKWLTEAPYPAPPRILVAGSAYVHDEGLRELCKLWSRVVQHLDPNVDIVIIDSVSPFEPAVFLEWPVTIEGYDDYRDVRGHQKWIYRFKENIGHLSRGGQDGAGRTFCKSIELGIEGGYDYVAIIETDLIFLRSITDICKRLQRTGTPIAAVGNQQYQFPEFGVCFVDCSWAKEFDFVGKYNWLSSQPWPIPEIRIMNIVQDYLMLLPIYGIRVDQTGLTAQTIQNYFPYFAPAWVTHAQSLDVYFKAIMMNNLTLP